jgi:hypothetical protein
MAEVKMKKTIKKWADQVSMGAGFTWDVITQKDRKYLMNKYGPKPTPSTTK